MSRGCGGSERSFIPPGHRRAIGHPIAPDTGFPAALGAGNRRRGVGAHLVRFSRKARVLEIPETESRAGGAGAQSGLIVRAGGLDTNTQTRRARVKTAIENGKGEPKSPSQTGLQDFRLSKNQCCGFFLMSWKVWKVYDKFFHCVIS